MAVFLSEVLSHLGGAVVMMFDHFYAVVVVIADVDDQLTNHLIELSPLICRV